MNLKSFLEFKGYTFYDEIIELDIKASNTYFSGFTNLYVTDSMLVELANSLIDFPKNEKEVFFEFGEQPTKSSYFCVKFYPYSSLSHIGVQIIIETSVLSNDIDKNRAQFEIIVEPSAIDNFRRAIMTLSNKKYGEAILYGRDNRI
ncbi:hypothetical protein OF897_11390 [Chryseobacterium formosus]|uniref:Uncharacterized protein n=1 Tax=Chryseobacterium formosus TaxID=1537363 RepID=A0ABT3XTB1_9FLAO|nr:hypothetical protein [Chryseobacterium formosus]MCX8524516.1 hypothetical protein [Chryseobacterium formosus]